MSDARPPVDRIIKGVATGDLLRGRKAIAAYIGFSEATVGRMIRDRAIPVFRMGGKWCLLKSWWIEHLDTLQRNAPAA